MNGTLDLDWLHAHYDLDSFGATCKRCGMLVGYVTKHAAERHGDDVEVLPPNPRNPPEVALRW